MKIILLILTVFINFNSSFAADKAFLKCLAQEEKYYHLQKKGGALVNLNKVMISEFVQMSDTVDIKDRFTEEICSHPKFPASFSLLYIILHHQEKAFSLKAKKIDIVQRSKDKKTINEVLNKSFYAFVNFIDDLQIGANKPNCYTKEIPELNTFYIKARYILEDIGTKKLFSELKNLRKLFNQLSDKSILAKCQRK